MVNLEIRVFRNHGELADVTRRETRNKTPEERLDELERLRLEAGKFLYEYPARFRSVVTVTRRS